MSPVSRHPGHAQVTHNLLLYVCAQNMVLFARRGLESCGREQVDGCGKVRGWLVVLAYHGDLTRLANNCIR